MADTLYISGQWAGESIAIPASSLITLFSIQASCSTVPVQVVLVEAKQSAGNHDNTTDSEDMRIYQPSISNSDLINEDYFSKTFNNLDLTESDHCTTENIMIKHSTNDENSAPSKLNNDYVVNCESSRDEYLFYIPLTSLLFPVLHNKSCPSLIENSLLPAVLCLSDQWCVVGMCASLRYILQLASNKYNDTFAKKLLGFREGCLQSCAEVSCWTKFCEIESPKALSNIFRKSLFPLKHEIVFPEEVLRYDIHMSRPPILHNALKMKQKLIRETVKDKKERDLLLSKKLCELPDLDHEYAEGLEITLADVMLFACFDLILFKLSTFDHNKAGLVLKWHKLISANSKVARALSLLSTIKVEEKKTDSVIPKLIIPDVLEESLYKSDPERPKLHCVGSMTLQRDIDAVIEKLTEAGVREAVYTPVPAHLSIALPWAAYPSAVSPQEGSLPPSRLTRKCQQLENIVHEVRGICKPGDRIVDFCAGGGHLGIVLAHCLPDCIVILVENKSSSLERAKSRVDTLGLTNVQFYQCNLDYFNGKFDIGVCLHACGQATDLVLQKCYMHSASFVCSPCCYGSIQPNHSVQYPRSEVYRCAVPRLSDYLTLGHTADQTHGPDHPSTAQGQLCMRYIDNDRLEHANKLGYLTKLMLMTPITCSPKNHLLIGTRDI